jgi:hypothetical protein
MMRSKPAPIRAFSAASLEINQASFTLCFAADYSKDFAMIASFSFMLPRRRKEQPTTSLTEPLVLNKSERGARASRGRRNIAEAVIRLINERQYDGRDSSRPEAIRRVLESGRVIPKPGAGYAAMPTPSSYRHKGANPPDDTIVPT